MDREFPYLTESQTKRFMEIINAYATEKNCPKALSFWHKATKKDCKRQIRIDIQKILKVIHRDEWERFTETILLRTAIGFLGFNCLAYCVSLMI